MPRNKTRADVGAQPKAVTLLDTFIDSPEHERMCKEQPVTRELVIHMLKKAEELNRCTEVMKSVIKLEQRKQTSQTMLRLEEEIARIGTWLFGPTPRPSAEQLISELNRHAEIWSPELALLYLDAQRTGKPGKQPTDARQEGLEAANERRRDPNLPWTRIAHRVCRCGKSHHDRKCAERLRVQATELETFLTRLSA